MIDAQQAQRIMAAALQQGGEFAEIFIEERKTTGISAEDGRVDHIATGHDLGAGIRVISGEAMYYAYTDDLSEQALLAAAHAAGAATRRATGARVADLRRQPQRALSPVLRPPLETSKDQRVGLLLRADRAARAVDPLIQQVMVAYADARRRVWIANSEGLWVEDEQVRTRLAVTAVASKGGVIQTGNQTKGITGGLELFERFTPEGIGRRAGRQAITNLHARPAPSGPMPVVMCNGWGGVLFHEACGHGLEADFIHKQTSVFSGRAGQVVASPVVTAIDDGTIAGAWGTCGYDDEGHPTQRNVLIENGVLRGYMYDRKAASRGGRGPSGNGRRQSYQHLPQPRMTNTFIAPGDARPEDILADTKEGFYAAGLRGGQVNTTTGDFVFTVSEGYLIKNGKLVEPVRGATLVGNGPQVLLRIDAVGNDVDYSPGTCGKMGQNVPVSCGQPTLRITELVVGGTDLAGRAAQVGGMSQ